MNIGKKYQIESDDLNVTVSERHVSKKTGEERFKPIAYFATPKGALKYLVDLEVNRTGLKDLEAVCQKIDELHALIAGLSPDFAQGVRRPAKAPKGSLIPVKE